MTGVWKTKAALSVLVKEECLINTSLLGTVSSFQCKFRQLLGGKGLSLNLLQFDRL